MWLKLVSSGSGEDTEKITGGQRDVCEEYSVKRRAHLFSYVGDTTEMAINK